MQHSSDIFRNRLNICGTCAVDGVDEKKKTGQAAARAGVYHVYHHAEPPRRLPKGSKWLPNELVFSPVGGVGQIGMNFYLLRAIKGLTFGIF